MTDAVVVDAGTTPAAEPAVVAPTPVVAAAAPAATTDADAVQPVTYDQTGDPGLDLFLNFVGGLGIAVDHPAMKAADGGSFDQLKGHLQALGDKAKGWESYVALAEKSAAEIAKTAEAQNAQIVTSVHEAVGGKAEWETIQAWAKKEAEPHEKEAINAMLSSGPIQARAAAIMLQGLYSKAAGVVRVPADPTNGRSSSNGSPSGNTTLTRREAVAETNKLAGKVGTYQIEQRPEYRAIWARVPSAR